MDKKLTLEEFIQEAGQEMTRHFSKITLSKDAQRLACSFARISFDKGELGKMRYGHPYTVQRLCWDVIDYALIHIVNVEGKEPETYVDEYKKKS